MKYYNFIKNKREELGYSTRDLGALVGVSGSYISMIENNKLKNPPSEEVISKLCEILKFSEEEQEKFYKTLDEETLPKRVLERIEKYEEEILKYKNSTLEYELPEIFSKLNAEKKEKVLKFIKEFLS